MIVIKVIPAKPIEDEDDDFTVVPESTAKPCETKKCKGLVQNADAARFCDACKAVKNDAKTKNRTYKRGM